MKINEINKSFSAKFPVLSSIKSTITHKWVWKMIALLLAIGIWGMLISQDADLAREKVFTDVPVSITNSDTLLRSGLIVISGLSNIEPVKVTVEVPQKLYSTVTASNYSVRVDLSRIKEAGEQDIPILTTSSSTYGTVKDLSLSHVTVQVERYITRSRIPVRLSVKGEAPEGFYAVPASVDPPLIVISGPQSLANSVVRCIAEYDMSMLSPEAGTERSSVPFKLVDKNGVAVESSLISVTSSAVLLDSMLVEQTLYPQKEVSIKYSGITEGTPAAGYEVKNIKVEPETLLIAGSENLLESLSSIYPIGTVDVSGNAQTITRAVQISKPADAVYISASIAYITVEIDRIGSE